MTLATQEDIVDAQVVLTKIEALQLVEELRQLATTYAKTKAAIREKLEYARNSNAWEQIDGCKSYGDFIAHTFGDIPIRWDRDDRQELVADMAFHDDGGMSTRQIGAALHVDQKTIVNDMRRSEEFSSDQPRKVQSSDGITRTYNTKPKDEWPVVPPAEPDGEKEMPATLAHKTPYKPGYVLATDTKGYDLIEVGEDGRAHGNRKSVVAALEYARNNPREPQYTAVKNSGISKTTIVQAYSSLRRNDEIPPQTQTGRKPAEEFALIAMAIKNLGLSIDRLMEEGTLDYVEADDTDFYIEGMKEGLASIKKFGRETDRLRNSGQ